MEPKALVPVFVPWFGAKKPTHSPAAAAAGPRARPAMNPDILLDEVLDAVITHYNAEKLKDATTA